MSVKDKIISLYYDQKMSNKLIAMELNIGKSYVTKIVKSDKRYLDEKKQRKNQNFIKRRIVKAECAKTRRNSARNERLDGYMELQHSQSVSELSGRRSINNRVIKKWNGSIYDFYNKTKEYRIKEDFKDKASYALPKKIKWS